MDKTFKIGLLVGILAIAVALFQHSQNARYSYSTSGDSGIVLDTRTGEFWTVDGSHYEPRAARITTHEPFVVNDAGRDRRVNNYLDCLHNSKDPTKCGSELLGEIRKENEAVAHTDKAGQLAPSNQSGEIGPNVPAITH
jgi:hypothetical protein